MLTHLFFINFSLAVGLRLFASAKLIASHRDKYFRTVTSVVYTASGIYFSWRSQTVLLAYSWPLSSKLQQLTILYPLNHRRSPTRMSMTSSIWSRNDGMVSGSMFVYPGFTASSLLYNLHFSWFTVEKGQYI